MTKLQQLVFQDAFARYRNENAEADESCAFQNYDIPSDKEIKENGYEGAVENVLQQMNSVGMI
jgi:hypothetical protein